MSLLTTQGSNIRSKGCQPPSTNLLLWAKNEDSVQLHKQPFAYSAKESDHLEQKVDLLHPTLKEYIYR